MRTYMICYQYTDDEGPHFASMTKSEYDEARDLMCCLSDHVQYSHIQLYQWDPERNYWVFLLEED